MTQSNPRGALVYGFWGQNIGNAFFNIGGKWIVENTFGPNVSEIQDQPAYRTFHKKHSGNPKNDIKLLQYIDCDYVVLQGPMLTTSFRAIWEPTFKALKARGTKIILLSAGFFRYTDEEFDAAISFLKQYPPDMISSRDARTYEKIKDLAPLTYSGIDSAFFWPRAYTPVKLDMDPYITVNFDQYPEPNMTVSNAPLPGSVTANADQSFEALGRHWALKQPSLLKKFSAAGQWQCYLGARLDMRSLPEKIDGLTVMRPEHRVNPHITWKVYSQPGAIGSDEPFTYFTIYSQTELTLSDRVHACVATLAAGKPAMLCHPTPRAYLFERLGLDEIREKPVLLDLDMLHQEQESELAFLRDAAQQLFPKG
ncbi:polysaccharide pyruvyl transferase family protein [Rubripirellula amarantea]|nr:polysaccharide pyruvyl transferase family protein [Rubripirellula amarantea]